jgi:AsmA protein
VRLLKWISWIFAGLVVLILLGMAVLVWVVNPNGFKPRIEAAVREATGREFTLVGDIELGFFPWLSLRTGSGQFGNAPGFPAEPLASWRSAHLGVKVISLIGGRLEVDRIRLDGADVRLTRHADGHANWEGIGSNQPAGAQPRSRYITIDGVDLRDSRLLFVDETASRRVEITSLNLTTGAIAPEQPFSGTEIQGDLHMDGFVPAGVPFRLAVAKAALSKDYSSLDVPGFEMSLGAMQAEGGVSGDLGETPRLAGKFESNIFDMRALLTSMGIDAPKTTDPKALTRVALKTTWRLEAGAVAVDLLAATLDDTHFTGSFVRAPGDEPMGDFTLRGDRLDIARYVPPADPNSPPFVLPTAALKALKFSGEVELEQATYEDTVMKGVKLRLLLDEQGLRSGRAPANQDKS